jgi:hypothetical protein
MYEQHRNNKQERYSDSSWPVAGGPQQYATNVATQITGAPAASTSRLLFSLLARHARCRNLTQDFGFNTSPPDQQHV